MIRREILLADAVPRWLLVSQVEHARLSYRLAQHCISHFGGGLAPSADPIAAAEVRNELLQAIRRHDDGWAGWEARPGLDPQFHRPLSFRELPLGEALANWNGSIRSAADVGPLAAWMVAGHFAALLEDSEKEHDEAQATHWLAKIAALRNSWFADWQALHPAVHTAKLAEEALQWLQAFDVLSLWLCSVCPAGGEIVPHWPDGYHIGPGKLLDMRLRPVQAADSSEKTRTGFRIAGVWLNFRSLRRKLCLTPFPGNSETGSTVTVDPWLFDLPELTIDATAHVVPAREYRDAADLLAAYTGRQLHWKLVP